MANEAVLPPHSPPNSAAAASPNSAATIAATTKSMEKCKLLFRGMRKNKNAKLLNVIEEGSVDLNTIASKLKAKSYSEPRDFGRDVRSVLDFGAKSSDRTVRDVSAKLLAKFERDIRPIISEWDVYYRGSLEMERAIDEHELNEFNNTPPKQTNSCTAMVNEAALPPHSPTNSAAAAAAMVNEAALPPYFPTNSAAAAAPNSPVAIAVMANSMEKCKLLFQGMRQYENAKLLNVIEEHSVDLNTIASKLKAHSYSEPRDFGRDVRSVLGFGSKSSDSIVRDVAAKLLAKLERDMGPIISEWDVYYWGSLEIEGAIDEHELNELVGRIRINSEDLMTDAEIAGFEATLQYYQPASHTHGASTSTDPPNKRRKPS